MGLRENRAAAADLENVGTDLPSAGLITSSYKIAADPARLSAYLHGEQIFPVAVEFDLTDKCNRACPGCPSVKATTKHFLSLPFIDRLLGILEGQTRGLLFTGGEPTIAPLFPETLALAAQRNFAETAVVSNGMCLGELPVVHALLEHVTALRVSLYDWEGGVNGPLGTVLRNLRALSELVERTGSPLSIGVSALTDRTSVSQMEGMVALIAESGAHWMYFHPRCCDWEIGRPAIIDQSGVIEEIHRLRRKYAGSFPVFAGEERYQNNRLEFSTYHAANFLLVLGADGKNYLSPETKYNADYVLADLSDNLADDFLWRPERLAAMHHPATSYAGIGSRHRTQLYNHLIERLLAGKQSLESARRFAGDLIHPYIL